MHLYLLVSSSIPRIFCAVLLTAAVILTGRCKADYQIVLVDNCREKEST